MQAQAIRNLRLIGKRPTLDLRVDHSDHNFYAEGVVVSNSHAVEYAHLTAASISLKARHPQAFYLTMLKLANDEPNPIVYMNAAIAEMRATGIQLLPPDLLKSESDFSIQDGHVRFGLSHIKGVSTATMAKIGSFKRDFESKFEMFEAAKAAKLDIRTMGGLILCGCLDSLIHDGSSRAKMTLEAQLYNLLTPNEKLLAKKYAPEFGWDLTALLKGVADKRDEKGKALIRETRLATLRRDQEEYWEAYQRNERNAELTSYLHERALLGFSYTSTLFQVYSKKIMGLTKLATIAARGAESPKETVKTVGFLGDGKMHVSAKGVGYWKGELYDDEGTILAMLHGEEKLSACRSYNGDIPGKGAIVTATGSLSKDGKLMFLESMIEQHNPTRVKRGKADVEI